MPLKERLKSNNRHGDAISFYDDVPSILHHLRDSNITVAAASRTHTPDLARTALRLLRVPPTAQAAHNFFNHLIIYPGKSPL